MVARRPGTRAADRATQNHEPRSVSATTDTSTTAPASRRFLARPTFQVRLSPPSRGTRMRSNPSGSCISADDVRRLDARDQLEEAFEVLGAMERDLDRAFPSSCPLDACPRRKTFLKGALERLDQRIPCRLLPGSLTRPRPAALPGYRLLGDPDRPTFTRRGPTQLRYADRVVETQESTGVPRRELT